MAEAVAAFSLAAGILQFIDFGSKLTTRFWQVYKSIRKGNEALPNVQQITTDLLNVLHNINIPNDPTSEIDSGLKQSVDDCHKVADDLIKILISLQPTSPSKREGVKAAIKSILKEEEIASLQERLDRYRAQVMLHVLACLRCQSTKSPCEQQQVLEKVENVLQVTQRVEGMAQKSLETSEGLGTRIVDMLTSKLDVGDQAEARRRWKEDLIEAIHQSGSQLDHPAKDVLKNSKERQQWLTKKFVSELGFPYMDNREQQVAQAHAATFRWIFDTDSNQKHKWSSFSQWLESDEQLYWITGKAGSGKSTLMKFICQPAKQLSNLDNSIRPEPRYMRFLKKWSASSRLLIARFYFWNSGDALQMTQAGLVRSLLHQILLQAPELVPHVSPTRWETLCLFNEFLPSGWSDDELEQTLRSSIHHLRGTTSLCLFIDGLDEFDGNHDCLINLLKDVLAINHKVKLCVSSRPWNMFEDAFQHGASLMLQDLTYEDIKSYTSSDLCSDSRFALLQEREPGYAQDLIQNIVSKASGVFLWVRLVLSSLLAEIAHGDRIIDLQKRLDVLPPELERLYDKMLECVDEFYLEHTYQLLSLVEQFQGQLPVLLLSFADEDDVEFALKRPIQAQSQKEGALRNDTMRRWLNACTQGLLELAVGHRSGTKFDNSSARNWRVIYIHRTVKDYLTSPQVQQRLACFTNPTFD